MVCCAVVKYMIYLFILLFYDMSASQAIFIARTKSNQLKKVEY